MTHVVSQTEDNYIVSDTNNITRLPLTSQQQSSLIEHCNDAISLYKHIKQKFIEITNISRHNKLQQLNQRHGNHNNDESIVDDGDYSAESEWNYLVICIQQLLNLKDDNISYHLLAIQIYQAYPIDIIYHHYPTIYLDLAIKSCHEGIKLSLIHLAGRHSSFPVWITTFYVLKAQILFQQKRWKDVIECISPSLKYQQSQNIHLLYNLRASAYCELKYFNEAISDYGIAINKAKDASSYYNSRGTCYHELGAFDKALIDYNLAIESNQKCVSAYNNRASLYVDMKKYKLALKDANKGLIIYEKHGNLYKHRGLAHFHLRNYEQCLLDLQKSIKFAPTYRPARVTLKMLWEFYYKNLIEIVDSDILHCDACMVLVDFIVGDNYQIDDNMVDATYADWKKEMALIEENKRRRRQQQEDIEREDEDDSN